MKATDSIAECKGGRMAEGQRSIGLLWHEFLYDIDRATASLMYLLQGMESVRNSELAQYNKIASAQRQFTPSCPKLTYVGVPLSMSGPGFDLNEVLRREGEAEQLAFKGWVEQVYNHIWEGKYRNELKAALEGGDIIRPEGDPIGDFGHIRNDLIHKQGVASEEETGKCTVLRWFKPGEEIVLGMQHVFDFLNQMGFMTKMPGFLDHGPNAKWTVFPDMEDTLKNRPLPQLVSIRPSMDNVQDDGSSWHIVSVVFENGVFADFPVKYPNDGSTVGERIEFFGKTHIDEAGNLRFTNGVVKDRESLYQEAVQVLLGQGQKIEGLGTPGPAFRIKRG